MAIIASIYRIVLSLVLDTICAQLHKITVPADGQTMQCGHLIEMHSLNATILLPPYANYVMLNVFASLQVFLWCLTVLIMICRVVLVVDFELVRVTINTIEPTRATVAKEHNRMTANDLSPIIHQLADEVVCANENVIETKQQEDSDVGTLRNRKATGSIRVRSLP